MIYVFGDIHGMYDSLKAFFINKRQEFNPDDKFIFLGDYIDYGPSSKEILDFLIDLGNKKDCIFLLGNHEYLMLDYLSYGPITHKYNTHTWIQDNGGLKTLLNFDLDEKVREKLVEISYKSGSDAGFKEPVADRSDIDDCYLDFLLNLKGHHVEEIEGHKFLFSHSAFPYTDNEIYKPTYLEEKTKDEIFEIQMNFEKYSDYVQAYKDKIIYGEDNNLWNRRSINKIRDYTMICGHTPCNLLDRYHKKIIKKTDYDCNQLKPFIFDSNPETIFYNYNGYNKEIFVHDSQLNEITMIDIDTGVRYGNCLTVLKIDENFLNEDKWRNMNEYPYRTEHDSSFSTLIYALQFWPHQRIKRDELYNMPYKRDNYRKFKIKFK